jgi:tetratricopeptide (TPR) repeat protein
LTGRRSVARLAGPAAFALSPLVAGLLALSAAPGVHAAESLRPPPPAAAPVRPPLRLAQAPGVTPAPGASVRPAALERLLAEARRLMTAARPREALRLLEPETPRYAGDPAFDYQLGIAALDAGDPGKAIVALERVLAKEPDDTVARAEIGRAFLAAKERDSARREFERVHADELPPPVRETVERYLAILALPESRRAARLTGAIELAAGYDDNVNLGTSLDRWVIGDGQALVPLAASRPRKSTFHSLGVAAQYIAPIGGSADWTIGVNLNQRINPSQHNYDLGSADATTGFGWLQGRNRYSVSAQLQHLWLDQSSFREAAGLSAQWQHELGAATQVGLYGQWFALGFPDQSVRDARRRVIGATGVHGFGDAAATVALGNVYAGRESSTEGFDELSFDFHGLRAGLSRALAPRWRAALSVAWERRRHDAIDSFFGVVRNDRQLEARLGVDHELSRDLTLTPQLSHLRNASNLGPNEFRRTQFQVALRYRF